VGFHRQGFLIRVVMQIQEMASNLNNIIMNFGRAWGGQHNPFTITDSTQECLASDAQNIMGYSDPLRDGHRWYSCYVHLLSSAYRSRSSRVSSDTSGMCGHK
jgi:hypothetical protein